MQLNVAAAGTSHWARHAQATALCSSFYGPTKTGDQLKASLLINCPAMTKELSTQMIWSNTWVVKMEVNCLIPHLGDFDALPGLPLAEDIIGNEQDLGD